MKTGFGKPNLLFNFLQLLLSNSFFTVFFTADFGVFFCFLVRDLCKSGCRHNIGPRLFTTSGQHSPVRPSHWVSERLIFSFHFAKWVHEPDPG